MHFGRFQVLRIVGSLNPFQQTFNRREVMRIGGLGGMSLGLPELLELQSLQADSSTGLPGFGRAKQIMLLYLQGAATQFETWDPKPEAPVEIRGEMSACETAVPGISICDGLPKLAKVMDRMAIVRSMTHKYNNHSNLYTLTGYPAVNFPSETNPEDSRHHPFFGSVLDYLEDQQHPQDVPDVPRNIGVPFRFSTYSPIFRRSGPYGAFLGHGYDPVWTEFDGQPTQKVKRASFFQRKDVVVEDPFLGITADSRLKIAKSARLRPELTLDRLDRRRSLLDQLETEVRHFEENQAGQSFGRFRDMAWSMISSSKLRHALDLDDEPMSLREKYGMTLFGQSALTGRRLLEAGCGLVSVFWDEYHIVNTAWDTHSRHFSRLGNELLPGFDSAVSTLLTDLQERGLLDETLVMCLTEHGRTPQVKKRKTGGGRDHWSNVYSVMLAGAGIKPGTVIGESDSHGAFVKNRPVSPEDILATMFHLKGINNETTIPDRLRRPVKLVQDGEVVPELLA